MNESENQEVELDLNQLNEMLPGGLPAGFLTKLGKANNRYYRGETKKLRRRADVLAKRKAQKQARKAQRGTVRGQKRVKGQRFRTAT